MVFATRRAVLALSLLFLVSTSSAQEVIVDRAISTTLDANLQPLTKGEVYPGGVYPFGASDVLENIIGGQREMTLVAIPYTGANTQGDAQVGFTAGSADQTTFSDGTNAIDPGAGFGMYPSTAAGSVGFLNVRWDGTSPTSGSAPALVMGGDFSSLTPTDDRPFGSLEIHLGAVGTNTIAEVRLYSSSDGTNVTGCTIMYAYNTGDLTIEGTDFSNTGAFSYVDDDTYLNLIVPADESLWASGNYPTIATCPGESVGYADLADIDAIDLNVYYGIEPAMYNLVFAGAKAGESTAEATLASFPAIFSDMSQMATLSANLKLACPVTGGSIVDCSKIDDGYELESDPLWIRGGTFRVVRRGAGPVGRGFTVVRRSDGGTGPQEELGGEPEDDGKQQVTFQVDLNPVVEACWFDPSKDAVTLPGSFNGWSTDTTMLTDSDSDGVYTVDLRLDPGTYAYKYFVSSFASNGSGFEEGDNRSVTVNAGEDLVLPVADYNKWFSSICGPAIDYEITFVVNMGVAIANNLFNPDTDVVSVAGSFNDWITDATVLAPFPLDPNIYTTTITESVFTPDTLYFKYAMRSGDVVGWEDFGYNGSNPINRDLIITGNETSTQIVTVDASGNPPYFNDIGEPEDDGYTIRDINAISADNIAILNAAGETLDGAIVPSLIYNSFLDSAEVTITAVIMSDPLSSGVSNVTDGRVDRVHVFVRDTAAVTLGNAGMGIQVVDGAYETTGMLNYRPGDVVTIKGAITPYGNTMQISPTSISLVGFYEDLGLPASLLDPEVITTADANQAVGTDGVQTNWSNWSDLRGQFVKVENAVVVARSVANPDRPDFYISTDDGATVLNFYDTSLSFRNDRSAEYPASFNVQDDDFVPPPVGAKINLSGYLVMQGDADQIGRSIPANAFVSIVPFEREHLEYLDSPPVVTGLTKPDFVPTTSDVTVSFNATVDATTTVADVSLYYSTSDAIGETKITATEAGGNGAYTATIPAQADGVFVTYYVSATDGRGFTTKSESQSIRFLTGGITQIAQIQETADGGMGDSPFAGVTTDMNINAVVTSMQDFSGILMIQDDAELAPWTGVFVYQPSATELALGTQINITSATIGERYGVTQLTDVTYTVTGTGKPYNYKVVPTTALTDDATAEAHEGMRLGFENVTIIQANANYGEWSFSSTGDATGAIKADDQSAGIASDFNVSTFTDGMAVGFIRGLGWYSFGEFKLVPETSADICIAECAPINPLNYDITFVVNMSVAIADSLFNPDTDVVSVAGSFNGWNTDATVLAPFPQDPNIYTTTITESVFTPDTLYFKYVMRSGEVIGWEDFGYNGTDPINRDLIITGNETSTQIVTVDASGNPPYFNDIGPSLTERVTLAILGEVPLSQDTSYIPVFLLEGETQDGIYAMDMTIDFDPSVLEITGATFMGTLMENLGFTYEINTETTGKATIAIAGSDPVYIPADLTQPAVLFGLQVVPVAAGQSTISLSNGVLNQTGTITLQDFQPNEVFVFDDTFVLGDVDANGDIQSYDASLVLQHIVEKITLDEGGIKAGDVDGDPGLTAADASTILQYRVALIDCFPVQSGEECGSTFNKSGTLTVGASMQPPLVTEDQAILSVDLEVVGSMTDGLVVLQGLPDHWTFTRAQGLASDWIQSARQQGGRLSLAVAGAYGVSGTTSLDLVFSAEATGTLTDEISLAGQFNGGRALAEAAIRLEELPQTLEIESIYPSPFTSSATVSFTVPEAMDVRLSVFDMLGREVGHLVDGVMEAGSHQVRWESEDVRSGLYIVRLESGARVITRSLVKVAP